MALVLKNRVKETTSTTGTGAVVMAGAASGFQTFASALADGDTTYYQITDGTDWEIGLGTWDEPNAELTRTTVYESSNSNSAVNWGAGSKDVFIVMPAQKVHNTDVYGQLSDLPLTGNSAGDQAYVTANNNLYIWDGNGWYKIAAVNQTPTVSGNSAVYTLATDGTATVVTMTGTDPEGFALTWSATTSGDTSAATVTNVDNVFTITPSTNSADEGTLVVTFSASDGVNIGTAQSSFTLIFVASEWSYLTLGLDTSTTNSLQNKTYIDRSSNANTITGYGSTSLPQQSHFSPFAYTYSVYFNGSDSGIHISDNSALEFGSSDFCVEGWVYPTADNYSSNHGCVFTKSQSGVYAPLNIYFSNGALRFEMSSTGTSFDVLSMTSFGNCVLHNWHHFAVVRSGSTVSAYVNGVRGHTLTTTASLVDNASGFGLGSRSGTFDQDFTGYISNVRYVLGSSVYDPSGTSITVPADKLTAITNTKLLLCSGNQWKDYSGNDYTVSPYADATIHSSTPFGRQKTEYDVANNIGSAYFDEAYGNYVLADLSTLDNVDSTWTIEAWAFPDVEGTSEYVIGFNNKNGGNDYIIGQTASFIKAGSFGAQPIIDGQWNHVALCSDGTDIRLFINGALEETTTYSGTYPLSSCVAAIGCEFDSSNGGSAGNFWDGWLADWAVSDTAKYTSAFSLPTAPISSGGDVLYCPFDNAGIFDKASNFEMIPFGDVSTSTSQTKFATTSIYFDGNGDFLESRDTSFQLFPPVVTIEFWIYALTDGEVMGNRATTTTYGPFDLSLSGGKIRMWSSGGAGWTLINGDFGAQTTTDLRNAWHHVAIVRDGTSFKVFVDGTSEYSTTLSSSNAGIANERFYLGCSAGNSGAAGMFQGYIENFQIFQNLAKYSSDFTVPSATQGYGNQSSS